MELEPMLSGRPVPPIPPSYEECATPRAHERLALVVSPSSMAALLLWDEEDDEF